jgi:periplasmic divalent cation tolerance protein
MSEFVQITTASDELALLQAIAAELIRRRLAACVQISGPVSSTFRWKGKIDQAQEWIATAKTTATRLAAAVECIRERHTYEVPEILVMPIIDGNEAYLAWLGEQVADEAPP